MNTNNLIKKPKRSKKKGRLDWKAGMEITKQNKTILAVVKRLADK